MRYIFFYYSRQQKAACAITVRRGVYRVSITQGQTRSSPFRTRAVSAFTAHRLISVMQSKHVINGPSQPPLFVVRQTLKSNVSTMGGKKISRSSRSADVRLFSCAEKSFILFPLFWTQRKMIILSFRWKAFCPDYYGDLLFFSSVNKCAYFSCHWTIERRTIEWLKLYKWIVKCRKNNFNSALAKTHLCEDK